ncbi:MAG: hypothetical protein EAZ92_00655 [Candidatus Kapaibacterium sp.]|nr:MAG: hypothetical protein EAZ92_00655 [Candidatus Kapabacteria bacterium]
MIIQFILNKLIQWLLPIILRRPVTVAWLQCLCKPMRDVNDEFLIFLEAMKLRAYESAQVMVLEDILNKEFDAVSKLIYIDDTGQQTSKRYLFTRDETTSNPLYVRTSAETVPFTSRIFLRPWSFFESISREFKVFIPAYISEENETIIYNRVDNLKIATTTFRIIRYTP